MDNWLSTNDMIEIHGIKKESLHMFKHNDKEGKYTKKDGKSTYFNESKLIRIMNKREENWLKSHDLYYEIKEKFNMRDSDIGRSLIAHGYSGSLDSWRSWLNNAMWNIRDGVTLLSVNRKSIFLDEFVEWAEFILQDNEDMRNFDSVDDYYNYWEAKKLLKDIA